MIHVIQEIHEMHIQRDGNQEIKKTVEPGTENRFKKGERQISNVK